MMRYIYNHNTYQKLKQNLILNGFSVKKTLSLTKQKVLHALHHLR
jgi:hypothetical protein